ncbi:sensor histidine kinase [Bacillus sp. B1-b2]|uniref:sensor histidine kinase n=1 Tax=Bacillus sp. B1-b2 TaxID=2653201 RepID=UPI0012614845|nr:HAMP domain-containing sensor histidine kinase [Bacillus sp. B1-b2]KAB7668817.1 HAMP domain-containing histidine kinase [Bacillus sp. B1-b2]
MRIKYIYQQLISHLSVILVALLVLSIIFSHYVEKLVFSMKTDELQGYGANIVQEVKGEDLWSPSTYATLLRYSEELKGTGITIGIFNSQQNLIWSFGRDLDITITQSEWNEMKDGRSTVIKPSTRRGDQDVALVAIPYSVNGKVAGGIILTSPLVESKEMINEINHYLIYILIIAFAIALLLSFVLSRIHVKRIKKLQEATSHVAEGDYNIKVFSSNFDEIGELGQDFNQMVDRLRESKEAIDALEHRRRQFMSDVSHELKTPLTTISGVIEGLNNNMIPEAEKEKGLHLIRQESKRLIRLVNENLDYDKIRSNQIVLMKENILVSEVLEIIYEQLYIQAEEKSVKIHVEVDEEAIIFADYDRLIQIIINTTKNSIQFTDNGEIWLRGFMDGNKTIIQVEDTGIGIEASEIESIWKRFYKADISRTNNPYGEFGLGLSIVKQLVQFHNGEIKVESEKGKGTIFTISFPTEEK